DLELEGKRIRLEREQRSVPPQNLELVPTPLAETRDEQLPEAGAGVAAHRVPPPIPLVEVAHDAHAAGVRRPDGEHDTPNAVQLGLVPAELLVGLVVRALAEQQTVEV